jgi:hypothetical protein
MDARPAPGSQLLRRLQAALYSTARPWSGGAAGIRARRSRYAGTSTAKVGCPATFAPPPAPFSRGPFLPLRRHPHHHPMKRPRGLDPCVCLPLHAALLHQQQPATTPRHRQARAAAWQIAVISDNARRSGPPAPGHALRTRPRCLPAKGSQRHHSFPTTAPMRPSVPAYRRCPTAAWPSIHLYDVI